MGLGLNPSPPGQRVLYSATDKTHSKLVWLSISEWVKRVGVIATCDFAVDKGDRSVEVLWYILELVAGHISQGFPQALPREQQQEARVTPTPISALQEIPPSPRAKVSRKQLPTRVSKKDKYVPINIWERHFHVSGTCAWNKEGVGQWVRLTHATHSCGVELKVSGAVTQVAPRSVHTQPVDAVHRVRTLVDVCSTHTHTQTHTSSATHTR